MVLGFSLVMRIQIAYQRFWEGTTQCHQASSKWADAVMQVMAFDKISADAFSEPALEFRMLICHYASLMNALALIDIRRDDELETHLTLNQHDPYLFRANANPSFVALGRMTGHPVSPRPQSDGGGSPPGANGEMSYSRRSVSVRGKGAGRSHRANTVPLQVLLQMRRNMQAGRAPLPTIPSLPPSLSTAEPAPPLAGVV